MLLTIIEIAVFMAAAAIIGAALGWVLRGTLGREQVEISDLRAQVRKMKKASRESQAPAKPQKAAIDIKQIGLALDMYAADNGMYPTTEQGLDALITKPTSQPEPMNWMEAYVEPTKFLDPWGNVYIYESPSQHEGYDYDLYSLGLDAQEGGEGENADITNWLQEDE